MKKMLIAGAASIALAALPVAGTFAATSVYDTLNVTVSNSCSFNRTEGEGTYNATVLPGNTSENFAKSTFAADCNFGSEGKDVQVTAVFGSLTSGENSIPYAATAVSGSTTSWSAAKGALSADATIIANNSDLINVTKATETQTATVWYSVGVATGTPAGTYTGYATYTLAQD